MSPSIKLRVSRRDREIASPTVCRTAIEIDHKEIETPDEYVAEVIASQGPTVLDVQHVGQVRGRRRRASGWMALGGLTLLAGLGIVAGEVGQDWEGYRAAQEAAAVAGQPAPAAPGHGLGGLGVGLALLGLVPFGLGVVRRSDAGLDHYTLGETPDASFPVRAEVLPGGDTFGLVRRQGDRYALCFTPQMRGEVHWSGHLLPLDALVARGHTIPAAWGHCFILPDGARCRVEHEGITYRIGTVARGKTIARRTEADKPFWVYNAGAFAVMGTLLALVHLVPEDALAMNVDELGAEDRFVGYFHQPDVKDQQQVPEETSEAVAEASSASGPTHAGPAGTMGDPRAAPSSGKIAMKGPKHAPVTLSRVQATPRDAGILGVMQDFSGSILASPTAGIYAVGNDDSDIWGGIDGDGPGTDFGVGGLTLRGTGRQGGDDASDIIRFGPTGLIGNQTSGDHGVRYKGGATIGHPDRKKKVPRVRVTKADDVSGSIDKDAIRRVVQSRINQVRHCYNQGLIRDPNLRGRVAVRFSIGPAGKVLSSAVVDNSLGDRDVATCVSNAVRRWTFPRPHAGGSAVVTYPFSLSPG